MSETTPLLMKMLDPAWRDDCDYDAGALKWHAGKFYKSLQASGPHRGGVRQPGEEPDYWAELTETDATAVSYKTGITSIQSIAGTFWFDHISGISKEELPDTTIRDHDWTGIQLGPITGGDKLQLLIDGNGFYWRHSDANMGKEAWDASSWRTFSLGDIDRLINTVDPLYLPLRFTDTTTEVTSVVPAKATTVRYEALEADGAGTSGLTITMARDIGSTASIAVTNAAADCSAYANHSVTFSIAGITDQTKIAAMLVFERSK